MRNTLAISLVALVTSVGSTAQAGSWTKVSVAVENVLYLAASSETKAIGIGSVKDSQGNDQMVWLRTADGDKWAVTQIQTPSPGEMLILTDLQCLGLKCFGVGMGINQQTMAFSYRVMLSGDGGDQWAYPAAPYNGTYQNTRWTLVDDKNVYLVGGQAVVLKSEDGGSTFKWKVPQVGADKFMKIQDGSFLDASRGWMVNGNAETDQNTGKITKIDPIGAVLKTTDGGATWTAPVSGQTWVPTRVKFSSDNHGYMFVQDATATVMKRTEDGGATWSQVLLPANKDGKTPDTVDGMWVFNDLAAVVIASGKITDQQYWYAVYRTTDGQTFSIEDVGDGNGALIGLACPSQKRCWVGGTGGLLFRYDGTDVVGPGDEATGTPDVAGDAGDTAPDATVVKELPPGAVCYPGELSCVADSVVKCQDDGSKQVAVENCATTGKVCLGGQCVEPGTGGGGGGGCNATPFASGAAIAMVLAGLAALRRRTL
jgi:uncharacterized protein (TIGR03382 family)